MVRRIHKVPEVASDQHHVVLSQNVSVSYSKANRWRVNDTFYLHIWMYTQVHIMLYICGTKPRVWNEEQQKQKWKLFTVYLASMSTTVGQ